MTDPYNSSPVEYTRPTPQSTPTSNALKINRLDISEKWKERFLAIDKAGGPQLPNFKSLSTAERRKIQSNFLAFFFWPVYLPLKGLWRQAICYFAIGILVILVMDSIGLEKFSRAVGYGIGAIAMIRTNITYYKKAVLGEPSWF